MRSLPDRRRLIAGARRLRIEALHDELVEAHGHDPRTSYPGRYWLPVVGPSALLSARLLVEGLEASPHGYEAEVVALGQALGLPGAGGSQSRIARTLDRLVAFGLAEVHPADPLLYRVRLAWPPLTRRQLARLPAFLAELHPAA